MRAWLHLGQFAQLLEQMARRPAAMSPRRNSPACLRAVLDRFEDVIGGLFAEAGQLGDAAVLARGLELGERGDAELFPQRADLFRAEALQLEQLEKRGRKLRLQVRVIGDLAGRDHLRDLFGDGLADAGNLRAARPR